MKKFLRLILAAPLIILAFGTAQAANFSVLPSGGSYYSNFTAAVYVKSPAQNVNGYSGTISFPKDKLRVVSISFNNSIVNFWAQQPAFSNESGVISFEGVTFNPGFTGSLGKIFDITFAVNSLGSAPVFFTQSQILANDGAGTNVATAAENASYVLVVAPPVVSKPVIKPLIKPVIKPTVTTTTVSAAPPSAPVVTILAVSQQNEAITMSGTFDKGNTLVVFIESQEDRNNPDCGIISPEAVVREEVKMGASEQLRIFLLSCGSLLELYPASGSASGTSFEFSLNYDALEDKKYDFWVKSMNSDLTYSDASTVAVLDLEPKPVIIDWTPSFILALNIALLAVLVASLLTLMKISGLKLIPILKKNYGIVKRSSVNVWNRLRNK